MTQVIDIPKPSACNKQMCGPPEAIASSECLENRVQPLHSTSYHSVLSLPLTDEPDDFLCS